MKNKNLYPFNQRYKSNNSLLKPKHITKILLSFSGQSPLGNKEKVNSIIKSCLERLVRCE